MAGPENLCDVRRAVDSDLLAVLRVHAQHKSNSPLPAVPSSLETATWEEMMSTPGLFVYLASDRRDVVGTATMMLMPNVTYSCAPSAIIEAVVVAPSHRRRGIATAMLQRMLADSRSAGCNKVQLLSHKRHHADGAHRLYRSVGFQPEAEGFRLYHLESPAAIREPQGEGGWAETVPLDRHAGPLRTTAPAADS
jgi:GNAT superfamily N-acetyltransferase